MDHDDEARRGRAPALVLELAILWAFPVSAGFILVARFVMGVHRDVYRGRLWPGGGCRIGTTENLEPCDR